MTVLALGDRIPRIHPTVHLTLGCYVIGDVTIGADSSIWYGAVVRGDIDRITIGERTNIQDNCSCHVTGGEYPLTIGNDVTIGHSAILHGCTIEDRVLVGMGATVMDDAHVHFDAFIAAGAVVLEGTVVPSRELWGGVPARRLRRLTDADVARIADSAASYVEYVRAARAELREVSREEAAEGWPGRSGGLQ